MARAPVVVLLALVIGCGSSDGAGDAAAPVEQHLRALSEGDYAGACRELTPTAAGEAIGLVAQAGGPRPRSCAEAYGALAAIGSLDFARAGVMDLSRAQDYGREALEVDLLDVNG